MLIRKKKIKLHNKQYVLNVRNYNNRSMCLELKNKNEVIEVTLNMKDAIVGGDLVIINPEIADEVIRTFKKKRIIRRVVSTIDYNNIFAPIVKMNMSILKSYDFVGVTKYQDIMEVK